MGEDPVRSLEARLALLENAGIANLMAARSKDIAEDPRWTPEQVKAYIEALLEEKTRALEMADGEREKAASALRGEQQRALDQAGREREKAADNLKVELARSMQEGDDRLREHIQQQMMQIQAALISAEKLEIARCDALDDKIEAVAEKLALLQTAAELAQGKFEKSVESRFAQVNEFRAALDDLGKTMATRRETEAFASNLGDNIEKARSERQHQIDELRTAITELRSRLDSGTDLRALQSRIDAAQGQREGTRLTYGSMAALLAAAATAIGIIVVIVNIATSG